MKYGNKIFLIVAQISIKSIKDPFLRNILQFKFWNYSINYHLKKHVSSHRSLIMYCFFPQIGHKIYPSLCPHFLSKPNMSGKTSCISDTKIRNFGASNYHRLARTNIYLFARGHFISLFCLSVKCWITHDTNNFKTWFLL